ncbi:GNAT family N-acetyltransferase [Bacillus thermotolerans]|uniref:Acetyltransferase, GNAT family n=1 Tax=Bacillus thermotolerans TaxID=1221996 RepID=A0A0F5HL88_BACTR|nr:GNAT family N-acetyltransferase [Bacillus thermotolerans]KKB33815.1 Acetyltransferase, GNAT family [Bacillus thermotolerans]KKB37352.1 Acetyltransferase, GNAT family [Bacillus thermotolerans]KKB42145.1 Acetyltransferase, GNAT family [Bacillus thermotolerans]
MIKKLDITNSIEAKEVLSVQIPSYHAEAEIIGYADIPPLKDTVETLQQCGETFFGYYLDGTLCGVISLKIEAEELDIHRLMVHPGHFRKGIAKRLLSFVEEIEAVKTVKVSTGSKNIPAIRLYQKSGFQTIKEVTLDDGASLTFFEKKI